MVNETTYTVIGTLGAGFILLGFYRTSIGRWTSKSFWYELDNLVGAGLLMIYNLNRDAHISVVLDIVWVLVALRGITSIQERRKARERLRKLKHHA